MNLPLLAMLIMAPIADPDPQALEEVQVKDLPSPMMWRVSREDHELWIIGTMSPMPINLEWNRKEVEAVVRDADEIIGGMNMTASINVRSGFALMGALPSLINIHKNPDKAKLQDLLPPEQFERWQKLEIAALGKLPEDDILQWRPMIIADALFAKTLRSRGLGENDQVSGVMYSVAHEAGKHVQNFNQQWALSKPRKLIAEFRSLPRAPEVQCLVETMDFIEQKLPQVEALARLWAVGDSKLLEQDLSALERQPCTLASVRESSLKDMISQTEGGARQYFLDMAGYVLLGRDSTVATMPIQVLAGTDGVLEQLRRSGYTVEDPR
jgi:uncharacterized protein YbaP (TraB family)